MKKLTAPKKFIVTKFKGKPAKVTPYKKSKKVSKPVRLNIGCGVSLFPGFINVDKFFTEEQLREGAATKEGLCANAVFPPTAKFVQGDMTALPFKNNYADYIESLEALEHLPFRHVEVALQEMYRVLKPGGKIVLLVPDLDDMCHVWIDRIEDKVFDHHLYFTMVQMFYGNQLHPGESHLAAFTKTYVTGVMNAVGFPLESIKATHYHHGEHPPTFLGAKWNPRDVFVIGMILVEATKPK